MPIFFSLFKAVANQAREVLLCSLACNAKTFLIVKFESKSLQNRSEQTEILSAGYKRTSEFNFNSQSALVSLSLV